MPTDPAVDKVLTAAGEMFPKSHQLKTATNSLANGGEPSRVVRIEHGHSNGALRMPYVLAWLDCSHAIEGEGRAVGDEYTCESCARARAKLPDAIEFAASSRYAHSRFRQWCGVGAIYLYRRDPRSPSGVMLELSIEALPWVEAALDKAHVSPLSPTEGL